MTKFGPQIIDSYPWGERYYNDDLATGADDGTSEADAWQSITSMIAGVTPGDRVNMKATASPVALAAIASFPAGSLAGPIAYRGYTTLIGDGGRWIGTASGTFNFRSATGPQLFESCTFNGSGVSSSSSTFQSVTAQLTMVDCSFTSDSQAEALAGTEATMIGCTITNTGTFSASGYEGVVLNSGGLIGCKIASEGIAADTTQQDEGDVLFCVGNLIISNSGEARPALEFGGFQVESAACIISENSTWGGSAGIHVADFPTAGEYGVIVSWNILSGCNEGFDITDTANIRWASGAWQNALGANTTADYNASMGDWATIAGEVDIALSGLPYASTSTLALDDTAGEGAACRSAGTIGFIGGTGTEKVESAFTLGGWREGDDDSGLADSLVGFSQQSGGAGSLPTNFGLIPINSTAEI